MESTMKLVRDKIPETAKANGDNHKFYQVGELDRRLEKKLVEEASEVLQADTFSKLVEECADVLEVLAHLVTLRGGAVDMDRDEAIDVILLAAQDKFDRRGGFGEGWVMAN